MSFQEQQEITRKLDIITQSFGRLTERLERAYTLVGDGQTLMRNLLDTVPCGILAFDNEFSLSYTNQAAQALLGEFIGSSVDKSLEDLSNFCSFSFPDCDSKETPFDKILKGESTHFPNIILCKETEKIPLEMWIKSDLEIFNQQYRVMILLDIAERKKIEMVLLEEIRLQAEFKSANRILQALLPEKTPPLENFEIAARCIPASSIGGDFYDWYMKGDEQLIFSLGDVMGQQMGAALLMTTLRSALRTTLNVRELDQSITEVAETLIGDFEQFGSFATVFHGCLQPQTKTLLYVSAGHTGGFMMRFNGEIEVLGEGNLPLRVPRLVPYHLHHFQFQKGDRLILYTRGIVRSFMKDEDTLEPIPKNLIQCLGNTGGAEEMLQRLFQASKVLGKDHDRTVLILNCLV